MPVGGIAYTGTDKCESDELTFDGAKIMESTVTVLANSVTVVVKSMSPPGYC